MTEQRKLKQRMGKFIIFNHIDIYKFFLLYVQEVVTHLYSNLVYKMGTH